MTPRIVCTSVSRRRSSSSTWPETDSVRRCASARVREASPRLGEDRPPGRLGGELDLADALLRCVERLLHLGLAGAATVELDPRLAQLVLDRAARVRASRQDPPAGGAGEAQLRERNLHLCSAVPEQGQPQPLIGQSDISVPSIGHEAVAPVPGLHSAESGDFPGRGERGER